MGVRERLGAWIPTREQIRGNRWLGWLGPWLAAPRLWRWSRRGVALGAALGVFFGLLVPIAQIPLSVAAAVVLRANVPAAAASTLVSNPVTFAPIYVAAYRLGAWVTGEPAQPVPAAALPEAPPAGLWQRLAALGKPLLAGLAIMATLTGLASYALITLAWRWRSAARRRAQRAGREGGGTPAAAAAPRPGPAPGAPPAASPLATPPNRSPIPGTPPKDRF